MKVIIRVVLAIVLMVGVAACGSSSNDTSPTTTTKVFPTAVMPDTSSVANDISLDVTTPLPQNLKTLSPDGQLSTPISVATNLVQFIKLLTDEFFGGVATSCNSGITADATNVECTPTINSVAYPLEINFLAYDFNGDGTDEGTGTATAPAVFRTWTDNARMITGYIETEPSFNSAGTMLNAGKGTVIVQPSIFLPSTFNENVMIKLTYDYTSDTVDTFDIYVHGTMPSATDEVPDVDIIHLTLTATTVGENTVYLLKNGGHFTDDAEVGPEEARFYQIQFVGSWLEEGTYFTLKIKAYDENGNEQSGSYFDTVLCADIESGNPSGEISDVSACTGEGLDISADTYIEKDGMSSSLTDFPAAFPASPYVY